MQVINRIIMTPLHMLVRSDTYMYDKF